jgi:ribosome biogenesis GTPase
MFIKFKTKAQVVAKHYNNYEVKYNTAIKKAKLRGKLFNQFIEKQDYPCVGDYVEISEYEGETIIEKILPRRTKLVRKAAGEITAEQIIASNIDYVFIVLGLDGGRNYSDRLLERFLTVAWNSGATPVVVLNKSDLNNQPSLMKLRAETIAPNVDVILSSTISYTGLREISDFLKDDKIGIFIGASGVGKSTLTNLLLDNSVQKTNELKTKDKRGRHTTSSSYMFKLKEGGFIIDSPGVREVQAWAEPEDLDEVFDEISELAHRCKFRNCTHQGEPGCAIQHELEKGEITPERYDSYFDLKKEHDYLERKKAERFSYTERQRGKNFSKMVKLELKKKKDLLKTFES